MRKSKIKLLYISSAVLTIGCFKLAIDLAKESEKKKKEFIKNKVEEYHYNHIKEEKYTDIDYIEKEKKYSLSR